MWRQQGQRGQRQRQHNQVHVGTDCGGTVAVGLWARCGGSQGDGRAGDQGADVDGGGKGRGRDHAAAAANMLTG